MNVIAKTKEEGVSLRLTFFIMLIISVGITAILLLTTYRTIKSFHALSRATDSYILLQDAAAELLNASDYLTEEAQCYTVLGERAHLDNYFTEAEVSRRREKAVSVMETSLPETKALQELKDAMAESVSLMNREYYAMLLMLTAQGDENIPEPVRNITLSEQDLRLSKSEKKVLAEQMMHDDGYYEQKNLIRSHLNQCIKELKNGTHGTQAAMEKRMHVDLVWITILILMQSAGLILLLYLTTSLGINPLLQAVEHIKQDQKIPIVGAHEFRYLAGTYNKMYGVYKRSIDNLSFKASHDELTGVYNRAGYDLIKRSVELSTTAFLLFDADHFKEVNDFHGHEVGDLILKKIAATLKDNFRSNDYICRIGGDEFMVLMVHVTPDVRKLIEHKVEQINRDLSNTEDGLPPITMSVGVSLGGDHEDAQQVFHETDIALYHVKDNGRNGCCFYTPGMELKETHVRFAEKMSRQA